jgi:hypothetical protein
MNKINEIADKVDEIANFYPNLDFSYILVAPKLLSNMLIELNASPWYHQHKSLTGGGFENIMLQTRHGELYVKPEIDLEEDDLVLMDKSGNRYSYRHFFVNMLAEKILLEENDNEYIASGRSTPTV